MILSNKPASATSLEFHCVSALSDFHFFLYVFSERCIHRSVTSSLPTSRFYNICSFRKNRISRRGPLNPLFIRFSLTRQIFQFFAVLQYLQFSQFSQKSQLLSGPSQPPLLLVFTDSTNFPIFRKFCNFRSCVQTWTYLSLPALYTNA